MPTDAIPESLLDLQRAVFAATAAVKAASAQPGRVGDWPAEQRAGLERLRAEELVAVMALIDARKGTPFEGYPGQKRLQDAARATS